MGVMDAGMAVLKSIVVARCVGVSKTPTVQ